jgi:hypothetical protein
MEIESAGCLDDSYSGRNSRSQMQTDEVKAVWMVRTSTKIGLSHSRFVAEHTEFWAAAGH